MALSVVACVEPGGSRWPVYKGTLPMIRRYFAAFLQVKIRLCASTPCMLLVGCLVTHASPREHLSQGSLRTGRRLRRSWAAPGARWRSPLAVCLHAFAGGQTGAGARSRNDADASHHGS
jgi:hypothetical protein